jgi:Mg-chelatase subunit ChlD
MREYIAQKYGSAASGWVYQEWLEDRARREFIRESAWKELLELAKAGRIDPAAIGAREISQTFPSEVLKSLEDEGYVSARNVWDSKRSTYSLGWLDFTPLGEGVIAEKILEEVFDNLELPTLEIGDDREQIGELPSGAITDFDDMQHGYDLIDLQETLVESKLSGSGDLLSPHSLKARVPESRLGSTNVILIDSSNSMYGPKFKGALMAALALKKLLTKYFRDDELYVVAYDDQPTLVKEGEVLRLRPQGNTDIGSALDFATRLLMSHEGNRNVFLITDGEPTSSCVQDLGPEESAYRAAYQAGKNSINVNVILLDQKPELRAIAEGMAKLNGRSTVTFVSDPLSLKEFIIKDYVGARRRHASALGVRMRQSG